MDQLRRWARAVRRDAVALWLAASDPRVPWYAKAFCGVIAAYALSPIDLIPDFIPVLGFVDEVVLLPLAMLIVVRMVPDGLMTELRAEAERRTERPVSWAAAGVIAAVWVLAAALLARGVWAWWGSAG